MAMPPSPDLAPPDDRGLERAIGPWSLGATAVNLSLGAGIFALPAAVAAILGSAALVAYLVCGLAIALVLTCFVELGSRTTRSGGAVAYIDDAFGPMSGFVAWVVYTLAFCAASDAAIALVLLDAVAPALPALREGLPRAAALLALFGGLAAINIAGVRQGLRVSVATTVAKLAPLLVVIAAGLVTMRWAELGWTTWPSLPKVGEASLLLFFAFSGAEAALTPGGEIRDPQRTVPRGMLCGTAALVLIYVSVQVISQGVLGAELPMRTEAPLAAVASRILGPAGWSLMIVCTVVATFGTLAGDVLASPRAFLPMAEDGLLPAAVGRIHPRFHTPHVAIALYTGLGCAFAISGAFKPLALLSSSSLLIVYFVVCLAALRHRLAGAPPPGAFRAPGGPLVPAAGMITAGWLLAQCTAAEAVALAGTVGVASAYYLLRRAAGAARA
jgi:basic amino acid/polyamine antiporter, APA family